MKELSLVYDATLMGHVLVFSIVVIGNYLQKVNEARHRSTGILC